LLWDALSACALIVDVTGDKTLADYQSDALLRSGVERQFIIIGEALNQFRRVCPADAETIPSLQRVIDFRHLLVHGYDKVDDLTVWNIIQRNLEPLQSTLSNLLRVLG